MAFAEPVKTMFNPFTNKQDYITRIDSNTVIPGSNVTVTSNANGTVTVGATGGGGSGLTYLKDTSSDTVSSADLEFNTASIGPVLLDSASCKWRTTITTAGNLVTSLLSCPAAPSTAVRIPCAVGESIGLLLALTCPG
jgi:hypothetical protein